MRILFLFLFQLTTDIAGFKTLNNFSRCEVYISMPYSELSYHKEGDKTAVLPEDASEGSHLPPREERDILKSTFKIRLNLAGAKEITKEWNKISYINSRQEAESRKFHILDQIDLFLQPGEYNMKIEVVSDSNTRSVQKSFEIGLPPSGLYLSDIQLATKIEPTDSLGKFIKNGLRIIPNPQCIFGRRYPVLYTYSEIYNLTPESEYGVSYSISNKLGELVQKLPTKTLYAEAKDVTEIMDIGIKNFKGGDYLLKIEVTQGEKIVSKEKSFRIAKAIEEEKFTAEELKYYDLIKYVTSQKELEFYNNLPNEAKPIFLVNFWGKAGKELLHAIMDRVKYSDTKFSTTGELGRDSDMGRIWIRYGKPDEREQYPHEAIYHSCEKWIYFGRGGIVFIFVDKSDYGRYELVYSNIHREPTDPSYRKWVNPEVLE
ncbi:GWxTD domain-containing protein [candidate division WOR-3 bacterium]|nr:GWxTD domain-containing protein [candidate division WOR-3 bacterium]